MFVDPRNACVETSWLICVDWIERHELVVKVDLVDRLDLVAGERDDDVQELIFVAGRAEINDGSADSAFAVNGRTRRDWIARHLRAVRQRRVREARHLRSEKLGCGHRCSRDSDKCNNCGRNGKGRCADNYGRSSCRAVKCEQVNCDCFRHDVKSSKRSGCFRLARKPDRSSPQKPSSRRGKFQA